MIGLRIGPAIGPRVGPAIGINADPIAGGAASNPLAGVSRDATSLVYCPATAAEWATLLGVAGDAVGGPSALHLCQEASGNLADSIGAFPLTATTVNGVTYRQAVTGWSRLGIVTNDGGTCAFTSTDAGLPDLSAASFAALIYFSDAASASNRTVMAMGTTTTILGLAQGTGVARILSGANPALGLTNIVGQVRPWIMMHNKTGTIDQLYTDAEKLPTPTFSATTTGKSISILSAAHPPGSLLYGALFFGAAAERTSTQWKTLLTTLGWSPAFS